jgi:UDP-N-acetylmuramoylalanine--D-glutamate ligase
MNLKNKKIGIWGFGVVGASVFNYVKKLTDYVQIIDKKQHAETSIILQTPENLQKFLDENDYIIPSPGIPLHDYELYRHKFICELDLFAQSYQGATIAITGTAGKTTVTDFMHQLITHSVAAGNIGFAMLDVLKLEALPTTVVLELSSYQLQYSQNFAPDFAIWTNFFPNHLDHHKNMDEYFTAKCNVLKNQNKNQIAIVPHELVDKILSEVNYQGTLYTYSIQKPADLQAPAFYIENNNLVLWQNNQTTIIFENIQQLPQTTFLANWIMILATLYLKKQDMTQCDFAMLKPQQHRVEYVTKYHNTEIYNDSKSTIQESTQEALKKFPDKKIAVFLGGMSKGANREPLIKFIATHTNITPFIFGQEKETLASFCNTHQIQYFIAPTLERLLEIFTTHHQNFDVLLFSPAGSSFDQFKNYQDRGNTFKNLVQQKLSLLA